MKHQHEWEGFQNLIDQDQKTICFTNEIVKEPQHKHHHHHHQRKKKYSLHDKSKIVDKGQTLETPTILNGLPEGFPPPIVDSKQRTQSRTSKVMTTKPEPKVQNRISKRMRFVPIPILYDNPINEIRGKIIYRGLMPRTSDNYFRLLKEVNWSSEVEVKKPGRLLEFNSRFESGNLATVCQKQYDLYIRFDTNTNGHMQWFYFSVKNNKKEKVKFNIFRFKKYYSLFQRGFRPYVKSRLSGEDWKPAGEKVKYYRQLNYNENGVKKPTKFFYLSFFYTFEHENDEVFMAACIPYTTTYLQERLSQFQLSFKSELIKFQTSSLCNTLCGQKTELLSIQPKKINVISHQKQYIIINTRSHPGQTAASWVADGFIESLLNSEKMHEWMMKNNICFKIVPMLNKDGVFIGNYRTGIVGDDFNRRFSSGQKDFFPQIAALRKLVSKCKKTGKILLFLDLHGHSILKNSFIFGPDKRSFQGHDLIYIGDTLAEISKYFSTISSHYRNEKGKVETARVYFQLEEDILSLTCQNSLGLYTDQFQTFQQKSEDWRSFGKHLLEAIKIQLSSEVRLKKQIQRKIQSNFNLGFEIRGRQEFSGEKYGNTDILKREKKSIEYQKHNTIPLQKQKLEFSLEKKIQVKQKKSSTISEVTGKMSKKCEKDKKFHNSREKEHNLEKSIILTRYGQSKSEFKDNLLEQRNSKTADQRQSISVSASQQQGQEEPLQGEQLTLPDNFSENYESINDSDSSQDDIDQEKKQQLFECIKEMNLKNNLDEDQQEGKNSLIPLKGFKEYKFSYEQEEVPTVDRRPVSKLKPLKYQQFKQRDYTEKRIKRNMDYLFANHSYVTSDREKARLLINKNEILSKKFKGQKKEQMMAEIFPHLQEHEYLLMRIREMKLQQQ